MSVARGKGAIGRCSHCSSSLLLYALFFIIFLSSLFSPVCSHFGSGYGRVGRAPALAAGMYNAWNFEVGIWDLSGRRLFYDPGCGIHTRRIPHHSAYQTLRPSTTQHRHKRRHNLARSVKAMYVIQRYRPQCRVDHKNELWSMYVLHFRPHHRHGTAFSPYPVPRS